MGIECACHTCDKHGIDLNCHATCEKYLEYRRVMDEKNEVKRKRKKQMDEQVDAKFNGMKRMRRGKRGRK